MSTLKLDKTIGIVIGERTFSVSVPQSTCEIADWQSASPVAIDDQIKQAFDHPVEFPSLAQAIVAGDRIALAVEPGLPQMLAIVEGVVQYLLDQRVAPECLSVSLAQEHESMTEPLAERLLDRVGTAIDVRCHHGQDPSSMGYLAAAESAEPIYVDRTLLEADVVIPITCGRDPHAWAYAGLYGIVPWFTDAGTQQRWRHDYATRGSQAKRLQAAKEVAWLLGIQPTLAVVPGANGLVDRLYFGQADAVEKAIAGDTQPRWIAPSQERFDLIVVTIDGDQDQQTWDNVARVLHLADRLVEPSGSVAILTQLRQRPGSLMRRLAHIEEPAKAERHLLHSEHPQSLAAVEILRALSTHSVYMMSQLANEQLEEIGIGAIADLHELEHLVATHERSLIISGAQHRRITPP